MKQVGICLPSYNESENIVQLINKILETRDNIIICVVDDNSPDNTYDLINQKFSNNENIKIIKESLKMVEAVLCGKVFTIFTIQIKISIFSLRWIVIFLTQLKI